MPSDAGQPSARPDEETREKRSRDRYGRDRGQRNDRSGREGNEERQQRPAREQQPLEGFAVSPLAPETAAPQSQGVPVANPANGMNTPASAAPVVAGLPKVQPFVLPLEDLAQVAQSSGLSWVNSDADKIGAAQAAIAAQPKAIHVPRERVAPVAIGEGPLVLVETKRDLRNLTLPFEETAN